MDLEQKAIERIKLASEMSLTHYGMPIVVTDSGGKDSAVNLELTRRAGVPYEVMHNHTTADAPPTVYHVRKTFQRLELAGIHCSINWPMYRGQRVSLWTLIPIKMLPPSRIMRYCCSILKETGGSNRLITTGVRWAESESRKNNRGIYETISSRAKNKIILNNDNDDRRQLFENCRLKSKRACNPIVDWADSDLWGFITSEKIHLNPLYEMGFSRVGCIGCPMARKFRYQEYRVFPQYETMWRNAFARMLEARKAAGKSNSTWACADDVFRWHMGEDINQVTMDEWMATEHAQTEEETELWIP